MGSSCSRKYNSSLLSAPHEDAMADDQEDGTHEGVERGMQTRIFSALGHLEAEDGRKEGEETGSKQEASNERPEDARVRGAEQELKSSPDSERMLDGFKTYGDAKDNSDGVKVDMRRESVDGDADSKGGDDGDSVDDDGH
jgi:hypothetical protein